MGRPASDTIVSPDAAAPQGSASLPTRREFGSKLDPVRQAHTASWGLDLLALAAAGGAKGSGWGKMPA